MSGDHQAFTLVPVSKSGYHYVMCFPGDQGCAWPTLGDLVPDSAVVLELEPEYWMGKGSKARLTYEQHWPKDVARYAASTGTEVSFKANGVPAVGRAVLGSRADMFWHHLTLAFVHRAGPHSALDEWGRFRDGLLTDLNPEVWQAPPECLAVLHVSEGDFLVLITPRPEVYRAWIASQVASVFQLKRAVGEDALQAAMVTTEWVLSSANGLGIRLATIDGAPPGRPRSVTLRGQFGRGSDVPITIGAEGGERFCVELPL